MLTATSLNVDLTSHHNAATPPLSAVSGQPSRVDKDTYWHIWHMHQAEFYHLCLGWTGGNEADAQDALSQGKLKGWAKWQELSGTITSLAAWLSRLLHNICMDLHRERQKYIDTEVETAHARIEATATHRDAGMMHAYSSPESILLRRETWHYVQRALAALPTSLREPCRLRFFQDCSYPDIAQQMGLSEANVRMRIMKARALLRRKFDDYQQGRREEDRPGADTHEIGTWLTREHDASESVASPSTATCKSPNADLPQTPGRRQQRLRTLRTYVRQHPGSWKRQLELAELLSAEQCWDEAIAAYRQVLAKQPQRADIRRQLDRLLRQTSDYKEAVSFDIDRVAMGLAADSGYHAFSKVDKFTRRPANRLFH